MDERLAAVDFHLSCGHPVGIVAAVSGHLARVGGFILENEDWPTLEMLRSGFVAVASEFGMDWELMP